MKVPDFKYDTHHIVAGNHPGAAKARAALEKFNIDINGVANGVFLRNTEATRAGATQGVRHETLNNRTSYYLYVEEQLNAATSREEAIQKLQEIRHNLQTQAEWK